MKTLLLTLLTLSSFYFNISISQNCIDIPNLPSSQINANVNDNTNYPVGSVYYTEANIEFIKLANTGPFNHQQGDTSLCTSFGNLMFNVSNAPSPKTLDLTLAYEYGMIVDNDTIFDNANPPVSYSGSNFSFTSSQNAGLTLYNIVGDFDTLEILANNLCIFEFCLNENDSIVATCLDIPNLPSSQINSNISDNTNYPIGEPFYNEGNIDFIKTPNTYPWSHQTGDTTICTSGGSMIIGVENALDPKTLYLTLAYESGLVVDGDTVFNNSNPPSSYSGSNFSFNSNQNAGLTEYTITGSFDEVEILANNLCIYEVCLEENSLFTVENSLKQAAKIKVFPNPSSSGDQITITCNSIIDRVQLSNLSGQMILNLDHNSDEFNLPSYLTLKSGLYIISIQSNGYRITQKLIVN